MIKEAIVKIVSKGDLSFDEAYTVMNEIMSGSTTATQNAAFLAALSTKSARAETTDEIAGCAAAMRAHATKVETGMDLFEIVGTGGDNARSFNISTTSALVAAAGGMKVGKHGNRAASSQCGTADCLEALGVNIDQSPEKCLELLKEAGMCFFFAQKYHTSMKYVGAIRRELGFRTIVLQSGEDLSYSDQDICDIVSSIKNRLPDTAVTLSIGEKTREQYQMYYDAGADRYLLRHESASPEHYAKLHPSDLTFENRKRCLYDLKDIGFQTGAGMMLESPYQTTDDIVQDLLFLAELKPEMIGIGPFIAHHDTPFRDMPSGGADLTVFMIGVLRLMLPEALIPATTALGTIDPMGREKGILAGANVIMPNLSPRSVRGKYLLYDGKISTGEEGAESRAKLCERIERIGYHAADSRGDSPLMKQRR